MAQAGYTPIQLYYSTTAAAVPTAANLAQGELAINIADGKLYYENSSGVVTLLASSTTVTNSFSAGTTGFTPSTATTGAVTLGGTLITSNGGTGLSSYTAGDLTYYATGTAFTKLAIGSAGQILTVNSGGTAPQWSTLSGVAVTTLSFSTTGLTPATATSGAITVGGTLVTSNGGTGLSSYTAGDLSYYASGTALTKLAIGSANRVLTSSGTAPQWVTSLTGLTSVSSTSFTENGYAVVSQADIGTAANEIPLNQYLGSMAYQDGTNYYNVGMTMGYRNRLFNGAMQIDQRNAGASLTITNTAAYTYTLDRFFAYGSAASKFSVQQNAGSVTPPTGFKNYLGATSLSAYTATLGEQFIVGQAIEGLNVVDLAWGTSAAKTVTLSFLVYSSLTGVFGGAVSNSAQSRSYPFSYSIPVANTWTPITVTISGDTTGTWLTTNGVGVFVFFGLGVGPSSSGTAGVWSASQLVSSTGATQVVATNGATFYITGVQFEVGTQATPFDVRPYGTELALCQRYCFVNRVLSGTFGAFGLSGFFETTTNGIIPIRHPVEMRASPTYSFTNANTFYAQTISNLTPSAMALGNSSTFGGVLYATVSAAVAGNGFHLIRNNNNGAETTITASAEL